MIDISKLEPNKHFATGPYKAVRLDGAFSAYGYVENVNGMNVLNMGEGRTLTNYEVAEEVAKFWNSK